MKDFQVLHRCKLDTIKIMKTIVAHVKDFESVKAEETSRITVLVELAEKRLESVLFDFEDSQQWEVTESSKRGEEIVVEV